MGKFFGRVFVGFFVSIPIVCILAGGAEQGFMLLLFSIVCTAGIGLVFWIPVWALVGGLTLAIIGRFSGTVEEKPDERHGSGSLPRNKDIRHDLALTAYIKQSVATGMDADEMTRRLQLSGWATGEIQSAYQRFISSQSKAKR